MLLRLLSNLEVTSIVRAYLEQDSRDFLVLSQLAWHTSILFGDEITQIRRDYEALRGYLSDLHYEEYLVWQISRDFANDTLPEFLDSIDSD